MIWFLVFVWSPLCAIAVPAIATYEEALSGSRTTSFRKLDDRRSLIQPGLTMAAVWAFGVFLFLT